MTKPEIKGYCPGALRPMLSGDGIVVRVRPFGGALNPTQSGGIAKLAAEFGNGIIDLSSRGNIQLRGVSTHTHASLLEGLHQIELLDENEATESRRNVLATPFWQESDQTTQLSAELSDALGANDAPRTPSKFGYAVDTGVMPVLQTASADVRIERDVAGSLVLAADGAALAQPVTPETAIPAALALAEWFMANRSTQTRMAALLNAGAPLPAHFSVARQTQNYAPTPGPTSVGVLVGLAFGQLSIEALSTLSKLGTLRMTPWRMLLVENVDVVPKALGLITEPDDPMLRVMACTGAPGCTQGYAETRPLARKLARDLKAGQVLHVSGCTKGCAHPRPATFTVTATENGFVLIKDGRAGDKPVLQDLTLDDIVKAI